MKKILNFLYKRHLTNYDILCLLLLSVVSQFIGWYALLLMIPLSFLGAWGEWKLENTKEDE